MNPQNLSPFVVQFAAGVLLGVLLGLAIRIAGCLGRVIIQIGILCMAGVACYVLLTSGWTAFVNMVRQLAASAITHPEATFGFLAGLFVSVGATQES